MILILDEDKDDEKLKWKTMENLVILFLRCHYRSRICEHVALADKFDQPIKAKTPGLVTLKGKNAGHWIFCLFVDPQHFFALSFGIAKMPFVLIWQKSEAADCKSEHHSQLNRFLIGEWSLCWGLGCEWLEVNSSTVCGAQYWRLCIRG